jgi:hypothetical protein
MEPTIAQEKAARAEHRATIEAWFRAHPLAAIEAAELRAITPHYQQRISEIRQGSKLRIVNVPRSRIVDGQVRKSDGAYRWEPYEPLGRDASVPAPSGWPAAGAPYSETWRLT